MENIRWKVGAFVDDVVVAIGSKVDEEVLQKVMEEYEIVGGAKLNRNKCETLQLEEARENQDGEGGLPVWGTKVERGVAVRYLGIWFSHYGTVLQEKWWDNWIEGLERKLKGWATLRLSLVGKICVMNIFWLPKIWYMA